jgi:hypothetical protein
MHGGKGMGFKGYFDIQIFIPRVSSAMFMK